MRNFTSTLLNGRVYFGEFWLQDIVEFHGLRISKAMAAQRFRYHAATGWRTFIDSREQQRRQPNLIQPLDLYYWMDFPCRLSKVGSTDVVIRIALERLVKMIRIEE